MSYSPFYSSSSDVYSSSSDVCPSSSDVDLDDVDFTIVTHKKKRSTSAPQRHNAHLRSRALGQVDSFDADGNPTRGGWTEPDLTQEIEWHLQGPNGHASWPMKLQDARYGDIFFHFSIAGDGKWSARRIIFKHIDHSPGREAVVGRMMVSHGGKGASVWTPEDAGPQHAELLQHIPHLAVPIGQAQPKLKPAGHPEDCQHETCQIGFLKLKRIEGLDFDLAQKPGSMVVLFEYPIRIPLWQFRLDDRGDRVMPFLGQLEEPSLLKNAEYTAANRTPKHVTQGLRDFNEGMRQTQECHVWPRRASYASYTGYTSYTLVANDSGFVDRGSHRTTRKNS